ncbi:ABC transporter ATP-binding protein [Kinneretia aquatilis]|uniref:ABC transporter ATP-binding protein n=1 Tax=Kinneretia aquatilis TaxID=2070761 RepID=UPI001CBECAF0|nr:ABC transporter ATP-binding protein [Paucibacter aquatile]WIV96950.1 ABC transporter ATP-binding protein [Paucibacter aquatile]
MTSTIPANDGRSGEGGSPAIELRGLSKHYGSLRAVDGVDLRVQRGEIFGLIGHNGAGKSTLFKMMLGLVAPSSGEVLIQGRPISGSDFRAIRRGLGYLPENVVLYDNLSGLETLQFFARLKGAAAAQCQPLLEQVGLADAGHRPLREYSKGMRQRLGFAQALLGRPQLLFLDEPSNGLDPQAIRDFYRSLQALREQGVTVLITSHILAELQERVDRLAIMAAGRIQAMGTVQSLREQQQAPLHIELSLAGEADVLFAEQLLAGQGLACQALSGAGHRLSLSCPREHKMAALALATQLGSRLLDLKILEPSLEDLFFGLGDAARRPA